MLGTRFLPPALVPRPFARGGQTPTSPGGPTPLLPIVAIRPANGEWGKTASGEPWVAANG